MNINNYKITDKYSKIFKTFLQNNFEFKDIKVKFIYPDFDNDYAIFVVLMQDDYHAFDIDVKNQKFILSKEFDNVEEVVRISEIIVKFITDVGKFNDFKTICKKYCIEINNSK